MLMMVDPHVHFHIIPRYSQRREHEGTSFADSGWPGLPDLGTTSPLLDSTLAALKRLAESSVAD
jgi:diadenosine tetraphosphate (Ap4A) HIT family hydrolase